MISGLNQEVKVLGRAFHFQTELTRNGGLFIRTEVFVGGKVVATRDRRLDRADHQAMDEEALRAMMKDHHGRVIERTLERVKAYQERKQGPPPPARPAPAPEEPAFDAEAAKDLAPPADEARRAAASAVRIRRTFGKLRLRLALDSAVDDAEIAKRLETASRGFAWIMSLPTFQEIRLDEQMRCHLVSDQINDWLAGDRDPARAAGIWAEIVTFNAYVAEINNRAELLAFDRQLLTWAAFQVQSGGMTHQVLDQLQWLSGRDLALDKLLDRPGGVADDEWFAQLCRVLAATSPPARSGA